MWRARLVTEDHTLEADLGLGPGADGDHRAGVGTAATVGLEVALDPQPKRADRAHRLNEASPAPLLKASLGLNPDQEVRNAPNQNRGTRDQKARQNLIMDPDLAACLKESKRGHLASLKATERDPAAGQRARGTLVVVPRGNGLEVGQRAKDLVADQGARGLVVAPKVKGNVHEAGRRARGTGLAAGLKGTGIDPGADRRAKESALVAVPNQSGNDPAATLMIIKSLQKVIQRIERGLPTAVHGPFHPVIHLKRTEMALPDPAQNLLPHLLLQRRGQFPLLLGLHLLQVLGLGRGLALASRRVSIKVFPVLELCPYYTTPC